MDAAVYAGFSVMMAAVGLLAAVKGCGPGNDRGEIAAERFRLDVYPVLPDLLLRASAATAPPGTAVRCGPG